MTILTYSPCEGVEVTAVHTVTRGIFSLKTAKHPAARISMSLKSYFGFPPFFSCNKKRGGDGSVLRERGSS